MSTPRRLLHEGTEFERELLSSARLDAGSGRGFKRTLAAMSAMASLGTIAAGSGAAAGGAAGTSAAWFGAPVAVVLVKWVGLGAVVGLGAAGSARWLDERASVSASAVVSAPSPPPPSIPPSAGGSRSETSKETLPQQVLSASPPSVLAPEPVAKAMPPRQKLVSHAPSTEALRMEEADDAAKSSTGGHRSPIAPPATSIEAEVGTLTEVRAALARGDARGALAKLDAYGRAFPGGVLAEEATVMQVDALSLLGDRAGAAQLARRFLASNPLSPHARHLSAVIERLQDP